MAGGIHEQRRFHQQRAQAAGRTRREHTSSPPPVLEHGWGPLRRERAGQPVGRRSGAHRIGHLVLCRDLNADGHLRRVSYLTRERTVLLSPGRHLRQPPGNAARQISNVPGATSYNVYAGGPPNSGCFGTCSAWTGNVPSVGTDSRMTTPRWLCLRRLRAAAWATILMRRPFSTPRTFFTPWVSRPTPGCARGVVGSFPPAGETAPLRSEPAQPENARTYAAPPAGDRANENHCDTIAGALATCPAAITPGAVAFYIPSGGLRQRHQRRRCLHLQRLPVQLDGPV